MTEKPLAQTISPLADARRRSAGFWLGFVGVAIFAMTLPMSRLAVGDASAPQLSPIFVTAGRAAIAGLLSVLWLVAVGVPRPQRKHWLPLAVSAAGTVVGFPIFLNSALREVESIHAAVVTGILPLATASMAALTMRARAPTTFWILAILGCGLVLAFAFIQGGGLPVAADALLLLAVLSASIGYVAGARVAMDLPGEQTICWVLILSLPLTAPVAWLSVPTGQISPSAWLGFGYVTLFSMWIGFFFWYRGLALGGVMRVSQVQLLQPFMALLFAVPIAGEKLDAVTVGFALAIVAVVFASQRTPSN
jgi:drug/metabolite transporter (DMT)-like permease